MALIKCPECGKEVSDKAKACPNCGCPIEETNPNGEIKIKFLKSDNKFNNFTAAQKVVLRVNGEEKWKGVVGECVELKLDGPSEIWVQYKTDLMNFGGEVVDIIDPSKGKKYCVFAQQAKLKTKLSLQAVDAFTD